MISDFPRGWILTGDALDRYAQHCLGMDYPSANEPLADNVAQSFRDLLVSGSIQTCLFDEASGSSTVLKGSDWLGSTLWECVYSSMNVYWQTDRETTYGKPLAAQADLEKHFAEQSSPPSDQEDLPGWEYSDHILYLLEVSERFDLKSDYKFSHQRMKKWIQQNPPQWAAKVSPHFAGTLASMLRAPAF